MVSGKGLTFSLYKGSNTQDNAIFKESPTKILQKLQIYEKHWLTLNPYPASIFLFWKGHLLITSAAYIHMHSRILPRSILFALMDADNNCREWREQG